MTLPSLLRSWPLPQIFHLFFLPHGHNLKVHLQSRCSCISFILFQSGATNLPKFDRTAKPSRVLSPMGSDSLRQVIIPTDLVTKFLSLASRNTAQNIETCGILAGKIVRGNLFGLYLLLWMGIMGQIILKRDLLLCRFVIGL